MAEFFGIDVGSSFIKAAVLDPDGFELRQIHRVPFPRRVEGLPPLHHEVDPGEVLAAVEDLLARLELHAPHPSGLVLCGQMHGFVLLNDQREAVSNYVSWLDRRVSPSEFDEIAARISEGELRELGYEYRPGVASSLLYWLERRGLLPGRNLMPVSIADFVACRLCGSAPIMEPSQAAAFGALRIGTLKWHHEVIGKLGLQSLHWPEVRPAGSLLGTWRGAPCYTAIGDQQCALAGGLLSGGELSVNIGTGSQVAMLADSVASGGQQTRPYFGGCFLRTITHIPGGRALSTLVGLLTEIGGSTEEDAWRYIERAVASVPSTDLLAAISFFPGPCGWSGFLQNLHEGNLTAGHVFRAVFESMARNYESCARRLDPDRKAERLVLSGGVARRLEILRDLTVAALGLPWRLSPHPEDTLFGLMVAALAFSGRQRNVRAATELVSRSLRGNLDIQ